MKRFLSAVLLLAISLLSASQASAQEYEYTKVDWYPLLTDSVGWNITSGGLAFGFVNGVSTPANVKMGKSFQISWLNVIGAKYNSGRGQHVSIGVGIDWRNYRLADDQAFVVAEEPGGVQVASPVNRHYTKSRLKIFAIELPVIFSQRIVGKLDVFAGGVVNFNVRASVLGEYESAEGKVREYTRHNLHHTPVTFDVIGGLKYSKVGAYVRYSPTSALDKNYGIKLNTLSVGVVLGL